VGCIFTSHRCCRFVRPHWSAIRVPIFNFQALKNGFVRRTEHRDRGEAVKAVIETLTVALVSSRAPCKLFLLVASESAAGTNWP
jgi:hypothetical protein